MSDDITALDVTDPDEIADELDSFAHRYAVRSGDYRNSAMMHTAADWLRHLSEKVDTNDNNQDN